MDIEQLKKTLNLTPLPQEGGFFAETYRAAETLIDRYLKSPGPLA